MCSTVRSTVLCFRHWKSVAYFHLVAEHENLNAKQAEFVDRYFEDNVYPVLTPMAMDLSRPFPLIRNKTLNIGALIAKKKQ